MKHTSFPKVKTEKRPKTYSTAPPMSGEKTAEQLLREVGRGVISKSVATKAMQEYADQQSAALKSALSELIHITSRMENIISVDEHYKSALERAKKLLNKQPQSESDKTE